jgi:Tetratricopeptide repeat
VVQQRPGVTGKPVRLASPPSLLAGREDLLADLHTRLTGGDDPGPRTVALWGFGGAGKTSVALAYAHRHLAEVGVAWQLAAEDPTVLADGFGQLAAQLGVRDVADTRDPVASVHGVLAAFPHAWLLIFDNAPDRAAVEAFLPPAGPGRVLITSQSALWSRGQALEVQVLDTEVAAGFLADRTGDPDRQAATDLASTLGGLPLALEQAAAYVQASGDSLGAYLASFVQRRPELLSRGEPTGYPETVATTWRLAFEDLQQAAPRAAGLLRLLAFCAPEAIPLRLLLQPRPGLAGRLGEQVAVLAPLLEDPLMAGDAIAALRRYSLVTPATDGAVSVHRLVQAVTADQMPAELADQWRQAAAALIEAAIPGDPDLPETWPVCAVLLPHAQATLADDSDGMARMAHYLGSSGSYVMARDLQRRVLVAWERVLGLEHPDTLTIRHQLATWTGEAGDAAAARDQYAELLPVRVRVLGPEHPDTLTTRHRLAFWTGEAGDPAAARDQLAALLPVRVRVLGPEHPDTLTTRHQLAFWTGQAGDAAAARDQLAALLPVRVRVLGPEHPRTLTTRANLATWTGQAGDPAAARDQYAALQPALARVLGPEHPDTLTALGQLAGWTGLAGDAAAARDQYAALLPVLERVLGPEHPDTLTGRTYLARWTRQAGEGPSEA